MLIVEADLLGHIIETIVSTKAVRSRGEEALSALAGCGPPIIGHLVVMAQVCKGRGSVVL